MLLHVVIGGLLGVGESFWSRLSTSVRLVEAAVEEKPLPVGESLAIKESGETCWSSVVRSFQGGMSGGEFGDFDIAELNGVAVAGKADTAGGAVETLGILGVAVHVLDLGGEVNILNDFTIEDDGELRATGNDGLVVPLTKGLEGTLGGWVHTID